MTEREPIMTPSNPASGITADLLCPDCGHHLHRPSPGACEWYDCGCPATEPRLDDEGPLHHHSDAAGTAVACRTLHRPSNPASGTNETAERIFKRRHPIGHTGTERREFMAGWDAALATEHAIGAAERELIGELVNALEWCDDRYRQTLAGKPVRDVAELRAYVGSTLTAARTRLASETPRPGAFEQGAHDGFWPDCHLPHPHTHHEAPTP